MYTVTFRLGRKLFVALATTLLLTQHAYADMKVSTQKHDILVRKIVGGLDNPWAIAFISPSQWLITERSGQLRQVQDGRLLQAPVSGVPEVVAAGQGGLLDVAVHPQFETTRWVYLAYSARITGGAGVEVVRGRLRDGRLEDVELIFRATPGQRGGRHFGSRLVFDNEGLLFISLGDRGDRPTGQNLSQHAGSIIRVNDDGSVPATNPFVGQSDVRPEIYSYGHRNVQGLSLDREANRLWAHEHGPQGGDELNLVEPGQNYGWPVITYGGNYGSGSPIGEGTAKPGMVQPSTYWVPSIAPSGLTFYDGSQFKNWRGNLFVGALKYQLLLRVELDGQRVVHEERFLQGELGRIRDVRTGPDGYLYVLAASANGALYRIEPLD